MISIMSLITYYSMVMNFDPAISLAVARQETNFNNAVIGDVGEIGVFQIRGEFIENYSKEELRNPEINIKVGIKLLKKAKKYCKYKRNLDWLVCYNAGINGGSKIKHPDKFKYVVNVTKYYKEFKNEYANSIQKSRKPRTLVCN